MEREIGPTATTATTTAAGAEGTSADSPTTTSEYGVQSQGSSGTSTDGAGGVSSDGSVSEFIGWFVIAMHVAIPDLSDSDAACLGRDLQRNLASSDGGSLEQGFEDGQLPPKVQAEISDALTSCLSDEQLAELQQTQQQLSDS